MKGSWFKVKTAHNKKYRRHLIWILCLPVFLLSLSDAAYSSGADLKIGSKLPSITLPVLNGASTVRVPDDYRGKIIVIHFWQIGCSSCQFEMHEMDDLYVRYRKKGLEILAVNIGQKKETIKDFVPGLKISYPVLIDKEEKSAVLYSVKDIPRTYIVDRKGIIRYRILGGASHKLLNKMILSLI